MNRSVERDAAEFGRTYRKTNEEQWMQALRVARCCFRRDASGRPRNVPGGSFPDKVSCAAFAEMSGVHANTVRRYYDAWQRAAEVFEIPHAADLRPGIEVDLPDEDFAKYHTQHADNAGNGTGSRPTPTQVVKTMTPAAAEAIAADPLAAELVARALADPKVVKEREQTQRRLVREREMDKDEAERMVASVFKSSTEYLFGESLSHVVRRFDVALDRQIDVTPKQVEAAIEDWKKLGSALQVFAVRCGRADLVDDIVAFLEAVK